MSASVVQEFYAAMKTMDMSAILGVLDEEVVIVEPPALPYGGTTRTRDEFFDKVFGYTNSRASFGVDTSEVFGDGDQVAGHFSATFTAHGSGETFVLNQAELYEVTDGKITRVEIFQHNTRELIEFLERNGPVSPDSGAR